MKKGKIFLAIFFIILLPIVFLYGCKDENKEEYSVKLLSSNAEHLEKIDYSISDKEGFSSTQTDNPDIHIYEKNEEVHLKLWIKNPDEYYHIDEEALKDYVTATSEADEPLEIEWNKNSNGHYVGKIILKENIVFNISGDIVVKGECHIYTFGDTIHYNYKFLNGENESSTKYLTSKYTDVKFDIENSYVKIVLESKVENPTEVPEKIYYIFVSEPPTFDSDYFLSSEDVFEREFYPHPSEDNCYESGYIDLYNDESLVGVGEDVYIAIFVAKKVD